MMNIDEEFLIKRIILLEKCPCESCKKEAEKTKAMIKIYKPNSDWQKNETT